MIGPLPHKPHLSGQAADPIVNEEPSKTPPEATPKPRAGEAQEEEAQEPVLPDIPDEP